MDDATGRPRRMRYSVEARCRAVAAMRAGLSPGAAAPGPSRSAPCWDGPPRPWARCCGGWGARGGPAPPRPPVVRYERAQPGELLHLDTKKLGRFWQVGKRIYRDGVQRSPRAGWPPVHVAVDDHSRLAYAEVRPSDRQADALAFLERALTWFRAQGLTGHEVMTDNGSAYSLARLAAALRLAPPAAPADPPVPPRTNGRAERFIQTLLRSWAYAVAYPSSAHRTRALGGWLRW